MLLTLSGRSFIKIQYSSFPLFPVANPFRIATQLQYYVKREKCEVNDVIFPSGCETRAINLGNKNMKIGIFTGGTSVRSKNIFTDISRYPTGKHDINIYFFIFSLIGASTRQEYVDISPAPQVVSIADQIAALTKKTKKVLKPGQIRMSSCARAVLVLTNIAFLVKLVSVVISVKTAGIKVQQRPTGKMFVYKIQVNPILTILKYGDYYDFMDR